MTKGRIFRNTLYFCILSLVLSCDREFEELDFVNAEILTIEKTGINAALFRIEVRGVEEPLAPKNEPIEFGIVWSNDNPEPTLQDNKEVIDEALANGADFIISLTDLLVKPIYYCRAFLTIGAREVYGETKVLSFREDFQIKLLPEKITVTNDQIDASAVLIINREDTLGDHGFIFCPSGTFPGKSDLSKVESIGETDRDGEFSAILDSLEFNTDYYLWAYAELNGELIESDPLQVSLKGGWRKYAIIDNQEFQDPVGESFGTEAIIMMGCGLTACGILEAENFNTIWRFNPDTDQYVKSLPSEKPDPHPLARVGSVSFKLDGKFYYGLGQIANQLQSDFWSFDPSTGKWDRLAPFPGTLRKHAFGIGFKEAGYIGTGCEDLSAGCGDGWLDDLWAYYPDDNEWKSLKDMPLSANNTTIARGRTHAVAFTLNDRFFAGLGYTGLNLKDLWEYNPDDNEWTMAGSFEVAHSGNGIVAVPIENKVFLGLGSYSDAGQPQPSNFWYELSFPAAGMGDLKLQQRQALPNDLIFPTFADFIFEIDGKAYMVGTNDDYNSTDIWQYVPAKD